MGWFKFAKDEFNTYPSKRLAYGGYITAPSGWYWTHGPGSQPMTIAQGSVKQISASAGTHSSNFRWKC